MSFNINNKSATRRFFLWSLVYGVELVELTLWSLIYGDRPENEVKPETP
jgi:hypothetical protein